MGRRAPHTGRLPTYIKPLCSFAAARTSSYLQLRAFTRFDSTLPLHCCSSGRCLRPGSGSSGLFPNARLASSIRPHVKDPRFLVKPAAPAASVVVVAIGRPALILLVPRAAA